MVENQDIVQGAITKTKLSKNLRLDLTNLPQGTVGQIPIIQSDGNWGLVGLSGDVSIAADGVTTVINNAEITAADIDTAFNFIHDQNGYLRRSPQKEGDTVIYEVENTSHVTEIINNVNTVATGATKKFSATIIWGTDIANVVSFDGDVATVTHGRKTEFITVSIIDVDGAVCEPAANGFVDLDAMLTIVSHDSNTIKIGIATGASVSAGDEFKLTVIG